MLTQTIDHEIESLVADSIAQLAAELRLVDISDYIAYLRMERFGCVADIVRDAAELFFAPGFVTFDGDGEASADWGAAPEVTLMLVLNGARTRAHVALKLCEDHAEVKLGYIDSALVLENGTDRTLLLADDISDNILGLRRKTARLTPRHGVSGQTARRAQT